MRACTPEEINESIDLEIETSIHFYTGRTAYDISKRIEELDHEWDIERFIETNAAVFSFIGAVLCLKKSKKWILLSILASIFLFQYTVLGRCPPVHVFRRLYIRTRKEIEAEKCALKVLRGDFESFSFQNS